MNARSKGNLLVILSSVIFGVMPVFTVTSYAGGSNPLMAVFLRSALALPFLLVVMGVRRVSLRTTWAGLKKMLLYCGFGGCTTSVLLAYSYQFVTVGTATVVHFMYPILVTLASIVILRVKMHFYQVLALILCTAGIFCIGGLSRGGMNATGLGLALLSAVTYAFAMLFQKHSGLTEMNTFKFCFYQSVCNTAIMLVVTLFFGSFTLDLTKVAWLQSFVVAVFLSFGAAFLLQRGLRLISSSSASILSTAEPLASIVMGMLCLGDVMSASNLFGCALILAGAILQARGAASAEKG